MAFRPCLAPRLSKGVPELSLFLTKKASRLPGQGAGKENCVAQSPGYVLEAQLAGLRTEPSVRVITVTQSHTENLFQTELPLLTD